MARPKELSQLYVIGAAPRYREKKEIIDFIRRETAKTAKFEKAVRAYDRKRSEQRMEVRYLAFGNTSVKISGSTVHLTGYVNVTGRDSRQLHENRRTFIEQVTPGTFKKALSKNSNVELRFNHWRKLCDQNSGLILRENSVGLYADATFTDPEIARKARNNQLKGWSFGFSVVKDHWNSAGDRRYLDEIRLREVSILDRDPAYIGKISR